VVNYYVGITATGDEHYQQFAAICELARITKVVSITVPSAELGTPFNEEVEHLQRLVALAHKEGVQVNICNQSDCLAADPDTITVLCDNVDNLGLAFDPSVYICGSEVGKDPQKLIKYVRHLYLRDSSPEDYQVRVGQGTVDYGQLVHTLNKMQYRRAMSVDIVPQEGIEHSAEMRKMRLLLESLL
jgi:sugar phosphate isomerase/epimerase